MRIVSLLASGTELVAALGAGDELVGRSHECDHPPWVTRLPALSRPTFAVDGTAGEIDRRVRDKLRAGEPLYEVDEPALAALRPDVVITQTHCEVCAVGPEALARRRPGLPRQRVATFTGGTLEGVLADFLAIAAVIGRAAGGRRAGGAAARRPGRAGARARPCSPRPARRLPGVDRSPLRHGQLGPRADRPGRRREPAGRRRRPLPRDRLGGRAGRRPRRADHRPLRLVPPAHAGRDARLRPPAPASRDLRAVRARAAATSPTATSTSTAPAPACSRPSTCLAEMFHPDRFGRRHEGQDYRRYPG